MYIYFFYPGEDTGFCIGFCTMNPYSYCKVSCRKVQRISITLLPPKLRNSILICLRLEIVNALKFVNFLKEIGIHILWIWEKNDKLAPVRNRLDRGTGKSTAW